MTTFLEDLYFRLGDAVTLSVVTLLLLILAKTVLVFLLTKIQFFYKRDFNEVLLKQIRRVPVVFILILSLYIGFLRTNIAQRNANLYNTLNIFFYIVIAYFSIRIINTTIHEIYLLSFTRSRNKSLVSIYSYLSAALRIAVWIVATLFLLSNLGYDISAFVAGLGITGLALALAVQKIAADLVSSITILLDKPIRINDYVTIGTVSGIVREIGIRATRLTTDEGIEVIIPNSEVVSSVVRNLKSARTGKVILNITFEKTDDFDFATVMALLEDYLVSKNYSLLSKANFILSDITREEIHVKFSFSLRVKTKEDLGTTIPQIINDFYALLGEKKYNVKVISLENPKV